MDKERFEALISDLYWNLVAISDDISRKYDEDWEDPRVAMASLNCDKGLKLYEKLFKEIGYDAR